MCRIFVVLGMILCSFQQIQAQSKVATSKIDSLTKLFEAAKGNAAKIKVMVNAPERIKEYFEKPAPIFNLYNKAFKLAESIGDKKSLIKLLIEIAYFEMNIAIDEPKAFKLYSQALTYAEEEKDDASCAKICFELAAINEHQNFRAEMYEYMLRAMEYNQKSLVLFLRPYRWTYAMYLEDNRIEDALKIGKQAVSYVDERSAPAEFKALAYGYYYAVLKRVPSRKQEADIYKQKTISLLGRIKILSNSNDLDDIATVCYEVGQYKLAIFFASQLFEKTDGHSQRDASKVSAYEIISVSYERLGKYQKSLEYYKKYSITYVKFLKNSVSLESGRKVIRAEGERNLLLKQKEIDKERFYRNISFAIAAFIVVLGGVILFFYRREQKRKAELTQLNATKDKLFAILSHDLRSPVGNLENNVMLTNWGALSREEFVASTQSLGQEISQVRTMLDNVLHWSISQMGGMKPIKEQIDLLAVLKNQIQLLLPASSAKSIQIINAVPADITLLADKNHTAIIFRNLLQNAVKFTNASGTIRINYFEKDGKSQIEVTDNGIGMSKERLAHLFQLDKSNSSPGTALEQGTGLGLVLVKELVELNGGKIIVVSELDKGTTFTLIFHKKELPKHSNSF